MVGNMPTKTFIRREKTKKASAPISPHKQLHHFLHMVFGLGGALRLGAADQQAEVVAALEHGAEVLGGRARIGDAQLGFRRVAEFESGLRIFGGKLKFGWL